MRNRFFAKIAAFALLMPVLTGAAVAEIRLPAVLGDGVVLQRGVHAQLWGWANSGSEIEIRLNGQLQAQTTASDGRWQIRLQPMNAGGPHQIEISGDGRATIDDVWFGDVWLASGQSNMELPMVRVQDMFATDIDSANFPRIRHFTVPKSFDFNGPRDDVVGEWQSATPSSVMNLSAVAFFFARNLHEQYGVPIGIIANAYGGSAAESWMSETALEAFPHYLDIARRYQDQAYLQSLIDADEKNQGAWYGQLDREDAGLNAAEPWFAADLDDSDWDSALVPGWFTGRYEGTGSVWLRRSFELPHSYDGSAAVLNMGRLRNADTTWVNGIQVGGITYEWPPRRYELEPGVLRPGRNTITIRLVVNAEGQAGPVPDKPYLLQLGDDSLDLSGEWKLRTGTRQPPIAPLKFAQWRQPLGFYNAMLAPLLNTTIKGVIWYQGETNADRAAEYVNLFPAMIRNWREDFGQGDFPFLFVQLANFMEASDEPVASEWAAMRDAQTQALRVPNTAMAVAIDVGEWNDVHPLDKKTVADRLTLAARAIAYGEEDLIYSGPRYRSLGVDNGKLLIEFDHAGNGLINKGGKLAGFAIAGVDGRFVRAKAVVDGERVIAWSDDVPGPVAVRYAWADNPDTANLYNVEGLPAIPFQASLEEATVTAEPSAQ